VNNTGTKKGSIMKQTAFGREKREDEKGIFFVGFKN
jgi:hypothetical protein